MADVLTDRGLGPAILGTTWSLTVVAGVCVCLRLYVRAQILNWDDWIMLIAMLLQFVYLGFIQAACDMGLGRPATFFELPEELDNFIQVQKWSWIAVSFGTAVSVTARVSIAILLLRVFASKRWFPWFITIFTTLTALNGTVAIILSWVYVRPVEAIWDPTIIPTSRWDPRISGYTDFVLQVVYAFTDLTFALFPVIIVWKLHMPLRRKIVLAIILALGTITLGAALTKVSIIVIETFNTTTGGGGTNYFGGIVYLATGIEQAMVIIMGCIPTFQSAMKLDFSGLSNITSSLVSLIMRRRKSSTSGSAQNDSSMSHLGYQDLELVPKVPTPRDSEAADDAAFQDTRPYRHNPIGTGEIHRQDKFTVIFHHKVQPKDGV